jgi:hypothetical protein
MWKSAVLCLLSLALASVALAQSEPAVDRDAETVYRIVSTQALSERRIVFRSVTAEMKAALWRVHLRHFLDSHPNLPEAQRAVVAQFVTAIGADLYRPRTDDPYWEAMIGVPFARMQQSASAILPPDVYHEALGVLGPPEDPEPFAQTLGKVRSPRNAPFKLQESCVGCGGPPPECECNMGEDWCGWGRFCFGDNCQSDDWGCGNAWQRPCNGMCR